MEQDLIEKLLTAQVLTLAAVLRAEWRAKNPNAVSSNDYTREATSLIKARQADLIRLLLSTCETDGS